ncbi:protein translocase subunit SecF [Permianibacter aggregans]|uniref:Protein-export membrane protein SecF n=1 Tax=Permianibacter aggregans TaxID=1510150 RepID=A0A4R6UT61_9GAMM|nr:protein translocase subunit SecF [Permianibacter aggregans]QGX38560.1 protein translocase subunit SecF [Permianibacter aggregans]TDQ50341.1 protein translocase subunit secF [Permianibacter aggregans]
MTTDTQFHIPWDKAVKPAVVVSILLTLLTIYTLVVNRLHLGLDFTGGTLIEVTYVQEADVNDVRQRVEQAGFQGAVVQLFGTAMDVAIRVPLQEGVKTEEIADRVMAKLTEGGTEVTLKRREFVSPSVGADLIEGGFMAMAIAFVGILLYISVRYEWKFALGAIIALIHDVMITLGIFSFFRIEFDLTVLAALLTVVGYSLNDTVVVFDRMKENFVELRNATPWEAATNAINSMLVRTLVMSLTTIFVLLALFYLGGAMIHSFAIAMLCGVIFGTYSSVYVATAAAIALGVTREDLLPTVVDKEGADLPEMP